MSDYKYSLKTIKNKLESLCLSLAHCRTCDKNKCLVWYAQTVCSIELNSQNQMIKNGINMVPTGDAKEYDLNSVIDTLALTLSACNECGGEHFENCNINILRLTLTHALVGIGDLFDYRGSVTLYLLNMVKINSVIGNRIVSAYVKEKNRIKHSGLVAMYA